MVARAGGLVLAVALRALASCEPARDDASGTDRVTDSLGWVSCNAAFVPLSDIHAAALVRPAAEVRPANAAANRYRPTQAELTTFLTSERDASGKLPTELNPYLGYVTGGFTGTTDEIIQWGAAKWGIPPDWLRAQYVVESGWAQAMRGDLTTVADPTRYPTFSRASGSQVYQSLGITQVKWNHPDVNQAGTGTEPLRWKSTSFNVDYQAAVVRFFFDDPRGKTTAAWSQVGYAPCNHWLSIAGWYSNWPWDNAGQNAYIGLVQRELAAMRWSQQGF